jgi:hypothetical protein
MTIQHLEQFHQCKRGLRFAVLVARERVDPAAEDFPRFALIEIELLANAGDEVRIDDGRIDLLEA